MTDFDLEEGQEMPEMSGEDGQTVLLSANEVWCYMCKKMRGYCINPQMNNSKCLVWCMNQPEK
jgi:hypothetical protein